MADDTPGLEPRRLPWWVGQLVALVVVVAVVGWIIWQGIGFIGQGPTR